MDAFEDPPCCGHAPPCALSFCWNCHRFWARGPCATEAAQDIRARAELPT
jgi:hypothetical protein